MDCGRNCVRSEELNCFCLVLARTPWMLARGIYKRLAEAGRVPGKQNPAEVQWRLSSRIPGGGYSACKMVFGSTPGDLFRRENMDEDLLSAHGAARSSRFVQQQKLRAMAQEAALKEIACSGL